MGQLNSYNCIPNSFYLLSDVHLTELHTITDFRDKLWQQSFLSFLSSYPDRGKFITNAVIYPIDISSHIEDNYNIIPANIYVADEAMNVAGGLISKLDFFNDNTLLASYHFDGQPNFKDDYTDYTTITDYKLYIPFVGTVDIDYQTLWSGFDLKYYLDITTGVAVCDIVIVNRIISSYPCVIGENINFGGVDTSIFMNKVISTASSLASSIIMSRGSVSHTIGSRFDSGKTITRTVRNPATGRQIKDSVVGIGDAYSDWEHTSTHTSPYAVAHSVDSLRDLASTKGVCSATSIPNPGSLFGVDLTPKIIIRGVHPNITSNHIDDYYATVGRPLCETKTLGDLLGYTEIGNIHIELNSASPMFSEELDEIEELLSQGFIINEHS